MTMINTAAPRGLAGFRAPARPHFLARLSAYRAARAERRATYFALAHLTERELDDIGLTPSDVEALR